ncbi:hypothetical protein [Pseudoalteromonas xiamenensis]|uniref:PKD domain-containing protein n=1 Tax=Pseudoalteromonas xiamenensis TaxID=882626 RepID=A0A975DKE6_9GAMM|nr:hypothetical protein [Pseudoalteromonas xiamenensis]QTH73259.1 hypothetical protein J5O05_20990 [Pseudoalteromonas xiamenensis]
MAVPVECKNVVTSIPIYSGFASCEVRNNDKSTTIQAYYPDTTNSFVILTQELTLGGETKVFSCNARLDQTGTRESSHTVCKYKPVAGISVSPRPDDFHIVSSARDYDGSIANYTWKVNGSFKSNVASFTLPQIQSIYRNGKWYSQYFIELEVTDNDGYKDSHSISITELNDECRTAACRNR